MKLTKRGRRETAAIRRDFQSQFGLGVNRDDIHVIREHPNGTLTWGTSSRRVHRGNAMIDRARGLP